MFLSNESMLQKNLLHYDRFVLKDSIDLPRTFLFYNEVYWKLAVMMSWKLEVGCYDEVYWLLFIKKVYENWLKRN